MGRLPSTSSSAAYCSNAALVLLILVVLTPTRTTVVDAVRGLRIVSPLQALTIWDPEILEDDKTSTSSLVDGDNDGAATKSKLPTHRSRFLPRFKAGLEAETSARKAIGSKRKQLLQSEAVATGSDNKDWADQAAKADNRLRENEAKAVERAFDGGVGKYDATHVQTMKNNNNNKYQFVGVVNPAAKSGGGGDDAITWYARKKPKGANWSVRLVHVNRRAIIKDLFNRGKVDIVAKYDNTGTVSQDKKNQPIVTAKYVVRERSWKNLWNFSPKHFFSDSSGMYWRERRLRPGLYTDGNTVYEASYRYRDGRNGMRRLSPFDKYLSSKAVDEKQKSKILRRLKEDTPDVVLED